MDDFQKEMFDVFAFETNGFLEQLETILMQAESQDGDILVAVPEIFRIMHTIKSSSAMMGLENVSKLAHRMEDLFFYIRENQPTWIDKVKLTDIVLLGVDYIKRNMDPDGQGESPEAVVNEISHYLNLLENGEQQVVDVKETTYLRVHFQPNCAMLALRAYEIITRVKKIQDGILVTPAEDDPQAEEVLASDGLLLMLPAIEKQSEILEKISASPFVVSVDTDAQPILTQEAVESDPIESPPSVHKPDVSTPLVRPPRRDTTAVRSDGGGYMGVEVKKLDELINLSGEIIIASMGAAHAFDSRDDDAVREALASLHRLILDMQDHTLALRMISLRDTFHKLNRSVRDATSKVDKKVAFTMSGEDTAVDRGVIDHVFSPLMHILRNAIDHGIELPEERIAAGKPETGSVHLSAAVENGQAVLAVTDDGRGIDQESVLMKAYASGLVTESQAEKMTAEEVNALIFLPGFSTKEQVSELSGRGVGMDVVNESVRKLSGKVLITSAKGQGTRMEIRLPLTMAILEALLIHAGDEEVCALPISAVIEAFKPSEGSIRPANGRDVVLHRDVCYPIIRLSDMLGIPSAPYREGMMLLLDAEGETYALFICDALQQQSVVVKPIPALLKGIRGVYGCTILGNGHVCLILDPVDLFHSRSVR